MELLFANSNNTPSKPLQLAILSLVSKFLTWTIMGSTINLNRDLPLQMRDVNLKRTSTSKTYTMFERPFRSKF
jgi:hypothetical protein